MSITVKEYKPRAKVTVLETDGVISYVDEKGDPVKKVDGGWLRTCIECGDEFFTSNLSTRFCSKDHYKPCPVCGKPVLAKYLNDPPRVCSEKCRKVLSDKTNLEKYGTTDGGNSAQAREKRRQTNLERYGVENTFQAEEFKEKIKQTNLAKYGVENPAQNEEIKQKQKESAHQTYLERGDEIQQQREATNLEKYGVKNPHQNEDVIEKTRQTNLEKYGGTGYASEVLQNKVKETMLDKYGVENAAHSEELKEKKRQTNLEKYGGTGYATEEHQKKSKETMIKKYGVDNPMKSEEIKEKVRQTNLEKYGVEHPAQNEEVRKKEVQTNLDRYGVESFLITPEVLEKRRQLALSGKTNQISEEKKKFAKDLKEFRIDSEFEWVVGTKFYDLYLPESNILIEIDPTTFHNVYSSVYDQNGIDPKYHIDKTELAWVSGYRCIHIFDWDNKEKIVQMLRPVETTLNVEECEVKEITTKEANIFLDQYHIQGKVRNQKVIYGVFHNSELLSMMSFGPSRYNKNVEWELMRYGNKPTFNIVDGNKKMFDKFLKEHNPKSVIYTCDLSKFTGEDLIELGFKVEHIYPPTKNLV